MTGITKTFIARASTESLAGCVCLHKKIVAISLQSHCIWKTEKLKLTKPGETVYIPDSEEPEGTGTEKTDAEDEE